MSKHEWWAWIPIPVDIIKNEDDVFMFKFRFDIAKNIVDMDETIIMSFDPDRAGCSKCQKELTEVFGESCNE